MDQTRHEAPPADRTEDVTERGPDQPTELGADSWWAVLKRTLKEFRDDDLTDWAAALTYYSVLSIFPALLVLVSLIGVLGDSVIGPLLDNLAAVAPGPAQEIFTSALQEISKNRGSAGALLVIGLASAVWSASNYIGAFMRASNAVYEVDEGRPFWKRRPIQIAVTIVMLVLLVLSAAAVVLTGDLARQVGNVVGLGSTAVDVWQVAKWPVLLVMVSFMISLLYWVAPNVKQPGFPWVTPGGIAAVVLWIAASAAFAFYVASFGSYNKTYGSLGGVVIFLLWLWISNIAVLFGAELNAELERSRELKAGLPAQDRIQLPPRDHPKEE